MNPNSDVQRLNRGAMRMLVKIARLHAALKENDYDIEQRRQERRNARKQERRDWQTVARHAERSRRDALARGDDDSALYESTQRRIALMHARRILVEANDLTTDAEGQRLTSRARDIRAHMRGPMVYWIMFIGLDLDHYICLVREKLVGRNFTD